MINDLICQWKSQNPEQPCGQLLDQTVDFLKRVLQNPLLAVVVEAAVEDEKPCVGPITLAPIYLTDDRIRMVVRILSAISRTL